ncbi:3'-5' exonuclease [Streptomyces tendae]|uniref:3'-5' exonuclease n=1 Tax=Streptomyces tendae TaxID=1932 RepID=UPI001914EEFF
MAVTLADEQYGIRACEIGRDVPPETDAVRIGTLHGFKGLEFQRVFLAGVSEGLMPHQRIESCRHDQAERYRQEEQRSPLLALRGGHAGPRRTGDHVKRAGQPFPPGPCRQECRSRHGTARRRRTAVGVRCGRTSRAVALATVRREPRTPWRRSEPTGAAASR